MKMRTILEIPPKQLFYNQTSGRQEMCNALCLQIWNEEIQHWIQMYIDGDGNYHYLSVVPVNNDSLLVGEYFEI